MRRLLTTVRWPFGIALTAWSYMWRTTTPIHRTERDVAWPADGPPAVDATVDQTGLQRPEDGSGPLFRRRYTARITGAEPAARDLMRRIQRDPNVVAPGRVATFEKTRGDEGGLRVGDEFVVRMPGLWDGPIRVAEVTPESFRFLTLAGHLEAGQIEWRARDDDGDLMFEIESWARGGDRLSQVMHKLRMAKEVQLYMWTSVLARVASYVDGHLSGGLSIETCRAELPPPVS
jgi:hypothetical protein